MHHAAARQAASGAPDRPAWRSRSPPPASHAGRRRRRAPPASGRSSAPRAPGRGRYPRSRCPWARDRAGRDGAPIACAARRAGCASPRPRDCEACRSCRGPLDGGLEAALQFRARLMTMAGYQVIIDHARRLHEGINRGGTDKAKALRLQRFGNGLRAGRLGRHRLKGFVAVDLGTPVKEGPQECRQMCAFREFQDRARIVDGGLDLESIAHDPGIGHQPGDVFGAVAGDALGGEAVECAPEILALFQDRQPRKAGLEALQDELFKERPVVWLRHTPFLVVVARVNGLGDPDPRAAHELRRRHDTPVATAGASSKFAQSGLRSVMATPPAMRLVPLAAASAARSRRTSASASLPATEPTEPMTAAPAVISAPASSGASPTMATMRLRACERFCMRLTTSWPTKQPLANDTPLS